MAGPVIRLSAVALMLALGACASAPPPAAPSFDAAAAVAAVRAAGAPQAGELDVQPLRDPHVEDLRQRATQLEARQEYRAAADLVDRALALEPVDAQDPEVLQQRAELALLLRDAAGAEAFARKAIAQGPATGPLCRRQWETVLQAALVRANDRVIRAGESEAQASMRVGEAAAQVRQARAQREACTVTAPNRY